MRFFAPPQLEGCLIVGDVVMDKDRASELIAYELNFDVMFVLTAVDEEMIDFGKSTQRGL